MTHRRTHLAAIAVAALIGTTTGCSDDQPSNPTTEPVATSAPTATASATPTATASPTTAATTSPNAPLACPETMDVIAATEAVLNEQLESSDEVCSYGSSNTSATGSIQSEDWFGARTLKGYRFALTSPKNQIKGIKAKVVPRPDFGPGAFMVTLTGGPSGAITNLVVPRPDGQFASISASRVKDGKFISDLELTEGLTRAFLDG